MSNIFLQPKFKNIANKILVYGLIFYVFFILGRSVWLNWQLKKEIDGIKKQIAEISQQNKNLENLIIYYQSDDFREIEARQKLGLKKSGETAVAVPTKKYESYQAEVEAEKNNLSNRKEEASASNYRLWWAYFFK